MTSVRFEQLSTIFPKIQKLTKKRHSQFSITLYPFFPSFFHDGKTMQETFWLHARGVSFTCERDVFLWKEPVLSRKRTMTARTISPRGTILLKQWLWFYFFQIRLFAGLSSPLFRFLSPGFSRTLFLDGFHVRFHSFIDLSSLFLPLSREVVTTFCSFSPGC